MPFGGLWNLSHRLWLKEWFPRPTLVWRRGLRHGAWTNTFWSYSWFFKNVWVWDIFKGWVKLEVILVWTPRRFFLNYRRRSKTKRTCKWFAQTWGRILSNILYRTFWWRFSASHCTSENIYFSLLELVRSLSHLKKCQAILYPLVFDRAQMSRQLPELKATLVQAGWSQVCHSGCITNCFFNHRYANHVRS